MKGITIAISLMIFVALLFMPESASCGKVLPSELLGPKSSDSAVKKTDDTDDKGESAQNNNAQTGMAKVNETWETIWKNQVDMITEIRETAKSLGSNFASKTEHLRVQIQPYEDEGRRLLIFSRTYKGYPNAMEAVSRRIAATIQNIQQVLDPATMDRQEAEGLLNRVNAMATGIPDTSDLSHFSPEMRTYVDDIIKARLRLTGVLAQYDSIMPSLTLLKQLEEADKSINEELPGLWKDYYLQKPVAWLSPAVWKNVGEEIGYYWKAMLLRLPVELPTSQPQWGMAALRFFIGIIFAGILCLILKNRWLKADSSQTVKHIFTVSLPILVLGFAFTGSSISATGDFFRAFLAFGCFCLILGQIIFSWDLRLLQYPEYPFSRAPFLKLLPMAIAGYLIIYLPITEPLSLVVWVIFLIISIYLLKKWRKPNLGPMQIEAGIMECYPIILWLCLFLAISGIHLFSILLYLAYLSFGVALEISFGGIAIVSRINELLPQEGARAVIARLLVALAAPFVLVIAVIGVCLWVAMLPGGTYILGKYALEGVTVGATKFNIIQVLLIVSVFYLTRTVVSMGTRFLAKLPQQGLDFDSTLITPMQTALTYIAWACFGLFVLRSLGMELSNLAMVAGGLSVGIGFGMQNIVNNFMSGLILIFGRTLQVGDIVEVGGVTGRVRKISVRATMVETYDNAIIYVPNSEFITGRLTNWTSFSRSVRKIIDIGVAYGSDTEKVISLLIDVAKNHKNVLKYPVPSVIFTDFGASSLDFKLRFWVKDFDQGTSTSSELRLAINEVFAKENIDISFPQLDVHLNMVDENKSGQPSLPAPLVKTRPRISRVKRQPVALIKKNGKTDLSSLPPGGDSQTRDVNQMMESQTS